MSSSTSRLDQLRRRRWRQSRGRKVAIGAGVVVIVALVVWLLYFSSLLTIHHVDITSGSVGAAEVRTAARVPMGSPLIEADLGGIRSRVEAIPSVASASVSRSWPQTIRITVTPRVPIAVVSTGQGLQNIDASGVVFGKLSARPAGLPLITLAGSVDRSALVNAVTVAASLPSSILSQVTSITVRTMDDIRLDMSGGRWIQWGNSSDSATKAQVAAILLNQRAAHIDVSVPSNPVTQ